VDQLWQAPATAAYQQARVWLPSFMYMQPVPPGVLPSCQGGAPALKLVGVLCNTSMCGQEDAVILNMMTLLLLQVLSQALDTCFSIAGV
jgi:hypothetical protein